MALLDAVLDRLLAEEQRLASEMIALRRERDSLDDAMNVLAAEYRSHARAIFKQRLLTPEASMLLLPAEHQHVALRRRLFDRFASQQRERAGALAVMLDTLAAKDSALDARALRQRELIDAKRSELMALAGAGNNALANLSEARAADARKIESLVLQLVGTRRTAEGGKPEKKDPKKKEEKEEDDAEPTLRWPVAGRTIVQGYGERVNPRTGTITLNPGINISASSGSVVKAAAAGIVSLVTWLPSFGTVVIIEHSGGYRTVYANLSAASVSRGRKVKAGEKIGTVGRASDGEYLHFEVWQNRTRRDPTGMLK
jgi:murein DD-endopeptidase MepM/ murein hydrolase activator NlpD